ncbi:hypothetical protein Ddye_012201 [Dipteronia dyeriana]|uniref:NAC domain-containing protein n=1 Tax=Dipteronia dyeriana TaxID=168575 RepID=A0AAE0CIB5_9ROSI|nr:hypothetical protein Ddye_012201 [Dipteronia dyeriana]
MAERFQFVRESGVMRLTPGFRFQPTDEELVFQYLKCKIFSCPLPATVIPHMINICRYDPSDLPGNMEQERYFFCNNEAKYRNGNRINRTTPSGYWKASGVDRQIVSSSTSRNNNNNNNNEMVGMKKTLVFYRGKPPNESRTDWIMHEYRLVNARTTTSTNSHLTENWVICRIFFKKSTREDNGAVDQPRPFHDLMMRDHHIRVGPEISSCSSSSSSSGISTEVSSNEFDHEESTSRNFFST